MPEITKQFLLIVNMPGFLPEMEPELHDTMASAADSFASTFADLPRIKQLARRLHEHGFVYFKDGDTDYVAEITLVQEEN